MESGFSKRFGVIALLIMSLSTLTWAAEHKITATPLTHDVKDMSQNKNKHFDQNGERCAVIVFETPIPNLFKFELGTLNIEHREIKDDELWLWVSPDLKKMTIKCDNCTPLKDYRPGVALKSGHIYRGKITTGLPQETALTQKVNLYCERTPFTVSIDGSAPIESKTRTYFTELPIGQHDLVVSASLCKPYSKTFRVSRGKAYSDTIKMVDYYGEVALTVTPMGGYTVKVDGVEHRQNRLLKVEPGKHRITIQKERYEVYETSIEVADKGQHSINAVLTPAFAQFTITTSDEETEIWVDGALKGHNRCNIELTWGDHRIEGRRKGFDTWEYPASDFSANSVRTIKIPKLNKQYGIIHLSFYPQNAAIYIDGKLVDAASGVYHDARAEVGFHYVQARLTDYKSVRDSFTVEPGEIYRHDYQLERLALGIATINTDPGIGIYLVRQDEEEPEFLGHTTITRKIPAGENVIILKNPSGLTCRYNLFVNDQEEHAPVTFPFERQLMIRTNAGGDISLKGPKRPAYAVKANKKLTLDPLPYEITIMKRGYQPYHDTIDLTIPPKEKTTIYRANMRKLNDTIEHASLRKESPFQGFYDHAGTWFIGIIDFGYTFDFNSAIADPSRGFKHIVTLGALPFRYKMFGVSLADFEACVTDSAWKESICYKPRVSLFVPCGDSFAFHFYGGLGINLYDLKNATASENKRMYAFGGISLRLNGAGRFPVDIFGEYKYPIKGVQQTELDNLNKTQLFRVGITFTGGIDH